MNLQRLTRTEKHEHAGGQDAEILRRCRFAKELEAAGEYEAARDEIGDRWQRVGNRPRLEGLEDATQAELLLRAGTLSGWIGSSRQIEGAQEFAKDLISESARTFERLGLTERLIDAQVDLAVCYWREGALDEARVTLIEVLTKPGEELCEPRLRALSNLALLHRVSGNYKEALELHTQSAPLFAQSTNHAIRGTFHNVYAQVWKELGLAEQREDYIDRALVEYAAASYHFERAGHVRFQGRVENNLGSLFGSIGRFNEAYERLSRARVLFLKLKDKGMVAHVDETLARSLLAEGRNAEAAAKARSSLRVFEEGDERAALAESLITHATALARLEKTDEALATFNRAIRVAEQAGDTHERGLAALGICEELSPFVSTAELRDYYRVAEAMLPDSQNPGIRIRLGDCARRILAAESRKALSIRTEVSVGPLVREQKQSQQLAVAHGAPIPCSLEEEVLRYEGDLIKRALDSSGGSVTHAARALGISHQGLAFILKGRHKSLLSARKPAKPRRRSIIRHR